MKAIILISSIFYILGLKIGNKIDLTPECSPVKKIISPKMELKRNDAKDYKVGGELQTKSDSIITRDSKTEIKKEANN